MATSLSTILHQLLHSRAIYPSDSFVIHRYQGVRCHASRVPAVGQYIDDFLTVAIPSVVAGVGESIVMIILEEEIVDEGRKVAMRVLERFEFAFEMDGTIREMDSKRPPKSAGEMICEVSETELEAMRKDAKLVSEAHAQLEHSLKQCLLSVLSLKRRKKRIGEKEQNLSFKLSMRIADSSQSIENEDPLPHQKCPQLTTALRQGHWREPDESSCLVSGKRNSETNTKTRRGLYRPIKDVNLPQCGLSMSFGMEIG